MCKSSKMANGKQCHRRVQGILTSWWLSSQDMWAVKWFVRNVTAAYLPSLVHALTMLCTSTCADIFTGSFHCRSRWHVVTQLQCKTVSQMQMILSLFAGLTCKNRCLDGSDRENTCSNGSVAWQAEVWKLAQHLLQEGWKTVNSLLSEIACESGNSLQGVREPHNKRLTKQPGFCSTKKHPSRAVHDLTKACRVKRKWQKPSFRATNNWCNFAVNLTINMDNDVIAPVMLTNVCIFILTFPFTINTKTPAHNQLRTHWHSKLLIVLSLEVAMAMAHAVNIAHTWESGLFPPARCNWNSECKPNIRFKFFVSDNFRIFEPVFKRTDP